MLFPIVSFYTVIKEYLKMTIAWNQDFPVLYWDNDRQKIFSFSKQAICLQRIDALNVLMWEIVHFCSCLKK